MTAHVREINQLIIYVTKKIFIFFLVLSEISNNESLNAFTTRIQKDCTNIQYPNAVEYTATDSAIT